MAKFAVLGLILLLGGALGCAADASGDDDGPGGVGGGKGDTSIDATVKNFRFKSEFLVDTSGSVMVYSQIEQHLFFTVGQLNADSSVSRLDRLEVLSEERIHENGRVRVKYEVRLPVAWGKLRSIPETYEFVMPSDMSLAAQKAFTEKYKHQCVEYGAHDVDVDSMWYDFRPDNCPLDEADIVRSVAKVTNSRVNTTGKYPEYRKIWEDDELRVVAIYGQNEKEATSNRDVGIATYNGFVRNMRGQYKDHLVSSTPTVIPDYPGVAQPDVELNIEMPDGRKLFIAALLVNEVSSAPQKFFDRYAELSERADLIVYSGHSGLGANIQTLAGEGSWVPGQYSIVYMNGCDSYAYVDSALWDAHAAINEDDPTGTKYLDIMMNVLPAPFGAATDSTPNLIATLFDRDNPKDYQDMFRGLLREPIIIVSGESDNRYKP